MLWHEFKDAAAMLYSSTAAGGTLEKALRDTCCDMKTSDSSYQVLLPEFERICMHLDQNRSLESVLEDFAVRSEDEDIACFDGSKKKRRFTVIYHPSYCGYNEFANGN